MERDALLDAGATSNAVAHRSPSIDGGPPLSSAVATDDRLARSGLSRGARNEAALGMMEAIARRVEAASSLRGTHLSGRFWNACQGGQVAAAQYHFAH
jgi:uncharacterized protein